MNDVRYTLNDRSAYGIYNGISQFDISDIVLKIKKELSCDLLLLDEEIAYTLNRDTEILKVAKSSYKPYPIQKNWTNDYKNIFLEQAKKQDAPGYGIIPNSLIEEKITQIIVNLMEEDKKEKAEREKILFATFEKAKETNTKQLLSSWTEDCNNPKLECSTDICYKYAMPDGTIKYERVHTY